VSIKADLECEWADALVDQVCDKIIAQIPDWQLDPATANEKMDGRDESDDYWRGYNAGIADIELMLGAIKDRQDA
jgi:hypothetical protein